ncbi:hypothetical protein D3C87_2141520 [compost metagenome]
MATQLELGHDTDQLIDILKEDADFDDESEAMEEANNLAFAMARLNVEVEAENLVETTDDFVIITIKIPRT